MDNNDIYSKGLSPIDEHKNEIPISMVSNDISKANLEELTCSICFSLIWDVIDCSNCGNIFCKNCINNSIKKVGDSCPLCRVSPFKSSGSKALKKLFSNIQLKCPNKSCKEKIPYYEYINHLKICQYRKYHCINDGCDYENIVANKKDIEEHSKICKYRIIECKKKKKKIKEIDSENHLNKECSQIVECRFCHEKMERWIFNTNHNNKDITKNIVCLKSQVQYYKNKSEEYFEKFKISYMLGNEIFNENKKMKSELSELKEKCNILSNKIEKLNEIPDDNNFEKYQKKSLLNKKRARK